VRAGRAAALLGIPRHPETEDSMTTNKISNRDAAKDRRRQRIVQAARALIRETGETGLSMRALAERAKVSLSTPYNLFGSKQAVLAALLDADIADYQARLRRRGGDALDTVFDAVKLGSKFFAREPEFYRAVLAAVYGAGSEYRNVFRGPRRAFWRGLVDDAIANGFIAKEIHTEAFATNLVLIYFAAIMDWVSGEMSLREMELRVQYGFALCLLAAATPAGEPRLRQYHHQFQAGLERYAIASKTSAD